MVLKNIDANGHQLDLSAANDFLALKAAATAAGHDIVVSTAYRSNAEQKRLYSAYISAIAAWERSGRLGKKPAPVAIPGRSKHEVGLAVDIHVAADPALLKWLKANAAKWHFYQTVLPAEEWHFEYRP